MQHAYWLQNLTKFKLLSLLFFYFLLTFLPIAYTNEHSQSHQCRLWGMIGNTLPEETVYDHLINLPYSLKNLGAANDDGWGLAYYNSTEPRVLRSALPAYTDPDFNLAVQELSSNNAHVAVGHVRLAASGASGIPNPHPFIRFKGGKWWAFGHNGVLSKEALITLVGQEYLAQNPPTVGSNWSDPNVVDSELYLLYILKCVEENGWDVTAGIARAVGDISSVDSGAMNFFLTDGETLWGFCLGNTLYYEYTVNSQERYSALASQPPTNTQDGWIALRDYNLVILTRNSPPVVIEDVIAVPEFPSSTVIVVAMLLTLLILVVHRKKSQTQQKSE
jgi:hypothetical protein